MHSVIRRKPAKQDRYAHTAEYRADRWSTSSLPLAGQYAGGNPSGVDLGSCSISRYCSMRSRLCTAVSRIFVDPQSSTYLLPRTQIV